MNVPVKFKRVFCMAIAVFMLLIFCAAGHSCHHDQCPVCMRTAAFKLTLGALAFLFVRAVLQHIGLAEALLRYAPNKGGTLVTLKVKLSD